MKTVLALALLALALPGCLVMSSEKTEVEGTPVSEETFSQIQPGSPEDLAMSLLGEPTSREDLSDGSTLVKWSFRRTTKRGKAILVIFAGSTKKEETGTIYVILRDGKVERIWRD